MTDIISIDVELKIAEPETEEVEQAVEESEEAESPEEEQEETEDTEEAISQGHGEFEDALDEAIEKAVEDAVEKIKPKEAITPDAYEQLTDMLGIANQQGLQNLRRAATNPQGFAQDGIMGLLQSSSKGILIAAIVTTLLQLPELSSELIKVFAQKGTFLNQDFHRRFLEEVQLAIDRNLQYRRAVGLDVIITSQNPGYLLKDPAFVTNSLVGIDTEAFLRLTEKETQYGYVTGL